MKKRNSHTRSFLVAALVAGAVTVALSASANAGTSPNRQIYCTDFAPHIDLFLSTQDGQMVGVDPAIGGASAHYSVSTKHFTLTSSSPSASWTTTVEDGTYNTNGSQDVRALVASSLNSKGGINSAVAKMAHASSGDDSTIHLITCSFFRNGSKWTTDAHASGDISKTQPVSAAAAANFSALNQDKHDWVFLALARGDSGYAGRSTSTKIAVSKSSF